MRAWLALLLGIVAALWAGPAPAHEVRPALLQVTETAPDRYEVLWKRPILGDVALRLRPALSSGWLEAPPRDQFAGSGYLVTTWSVRSTTPLDGQAVSVDGLRESLTDVLLQATTADGRRIDAVLTPAHPSLRLDLSRPQAPGAPAYLRLGVEHILGGIDHLMFVAGLLLLIGPSLRLFKAVTAFTVAHSITLAAASLGWVTAPSAVIEALVALSIVFVAVELARGPGADTLTRRHPWIVAFTFGLLHGFAFAGALSEIGLPPHQAAPALFLFNVGVEIGQLLFVSVCVALLWVFARVRAATGFRPPRFAGLAPAYAIGCFAAFWFLERLGAAFT
jgi:hypothetical protein